ncbi:MAG: tRNA (adenosine(37)-N6)-threonylcarbamoyltransferase complex ATPase subunit type 1 TsaE [Bacteroidota bacterium]
MTIEINGTSELDSAANSLLSFAGANRIFVFYGDMGAGKTTFIKSICSTLGIAETVSSPTFSIVNEYQGSGQTIYHFDFYRIKSIQEAYDIGYEEYFYSGNICLVEWPEKIQELLPSPRVEIKITTVDENKRILELTNV